MRKFVLATATLSALALSTLSLSAHAEDYSLKLEGSAAVNLTSPQDAIYTVGPALDTKLLFNLNRNWTLGPTLGVAYFPRANDNGLNAGLLWTGGATLRLQGDRSVVDSDLDANSWSPWVDVSALAANTGNVFRPGFGAAVGVDMALDDEHEAWAGVFVGYEHVFQTSGTQDNLSLDMNDVNIFKMGATLAFDFPPHRTVDTVVKTVVRQVVSPANCPACAQPHAKIERTEVVYFDFDKDTLRWESTDKLDHMIELFNAHPKANVRVQGHASRDHKNMTTAQTNHDMDLSNRRAQTVMSYLTSHGIDASRLQLEALGDEFDAPRGDNTTQEGRERNRRVQFRVSFVVQDK